MSMREWANEHLELLQEFPNFADYVVHKTEFNIYVLLRTQLISLDMWKSTLYVGGSPLIEEPTPLQIELLQLILKGNFDDSHRNSSKL